MDDLKEWVIVTRYTHPTGRTVQHVYGYYTKHGAHSERLRLLHQNVPEGGKFTAHAHHVIDVERLNGGLQ